MKDLGRAEVLRLESLIDHATAGMTPREALEFLEEMASIIEIKIDVLKEEQPKFV